MAFRGPPLFAAAAIGFAALLCGIPAHAAMAGPAPPRFTDAGRPNDAARNLFRALDVADAHGLEAAEYGRARIAELISLPEPLDERRAAEFDALLERAFMGFGADLCAGRLDPLSRRPRTEAAAAPCDLPGAFAAAIQGRDFAGALSRLAPQSEPYRKLQAMLSSLRERVAAGGWPQVPALKQGDKIEPGMTDERLPAVRARLQSTGELAAPPERARRGRPEAAAPDPNLYDDTLKEAVIRFQERHGLNPDGVIGKGTSAAMNATAEWRLCQAKIALDRLRGLNRKFSEGRFIVVNVPDFGVKVHDGGKVALAMKAIVGRVDRKTPMMSDLMRLIVFSPQWHVPRSIAVKDKLPEVRKDPEFFEKHGMRLYARNENGIEEVDPSTVDWEGMDGGSFDYTIVQKTGDDNALGRVKFLFPNKDNVYLHDTPTRSLFANGVRTFSSGCIRIQKPQELAEYLLKDQEGWDRPRIESAMKRSGELAVTLKDPIPIHIVYLTAWADADGTMQFRDDVYGHDRSIAKILCSTSPK